MFVMYEPWSYTYIEDNNVLICMQGVVHFCGEDYVNKTLAS